MSLTEPAVAPAAVAAGTHLGPVHLAVTDGDLALAIWTRLVGLTLLKRTPDAIQLGAGGRDLIVLHPGAERGVVDNTSGLYHVAIHVPTRKELARVTARLLAAGFAHSPTDHLVSEAVYLWDADGNGIEMTFETPWRGELKSDGNNYFGVTPDGGVHSGREPIDVENLLGELSNDDDFGEPLPAGTRIGHIHLHVAHLETSMTYYARMIGFRRLMLNQRVRMGDVTMDYPPHIVAFNTWAGEGARQPPPGSSGLRWFAIVVPTPADLAAMRQRLREAGAPVSDRTDGFETRDPSGNRLRVTVGK